MSPGSTDVDRLHRRWWTTIAGVIVAFLVRSTRTTIPHVLTLVGNSAASSRIASGHDRRGKSTTFAVDDLGLRMPIRRIAIVAEV